MNLSMIAMFAVFGCTFLTLSCNEHTTNDTADQETIIRIKDTSVNDGVATAFHEYCNSRFGYCIDYPKEVLEMQEESEHGDGTVFRDENQDAILTVYGRRNETPEGDAITLAEQMKYDLKELIANGSRVTYKKEGKMFYVISGLDGTNVFYRKTVLLKDAFAFAVMEYRQTDTAVYNPFIASIAASFK